jgi:hypothetical protein
MSHGTAVPPAAHIAHEYSGNLPPSRAQHSSSPSALTLAFRTEFSGSRWGGHSLALFAAVDA